MGDGSHGGARHLGWRHCCWGQGGRGGGGQGGQRGGQERMDCEVQAANTWPGGHGPVGLLRAHDHLDLPGEERGEDRQSQVCGTSTRANSCRDPPQFRPGSMSSSSIRTSSRPATHGSLVSRSGTWSPDVLFATSSTRAYTSAITSRSTDLFSW